MTDRSHWKVKKYRLGEEPTTVEDYAEYTPAQRFEFVWQITQNAWPFGNKTPIEPRLPRHVVAIERGGS